MKNVVRFGLRWPTVLAAVALLVSPAARAGLTVTPAAITNDYQGSVVLGVSGLTVGEKIQVKLFCDVNGNGLIDPGQDFVIRSFKVTDGQAPFIAGVRNSNVPGDDDGLTNGQVRIGLPYPGVDSIAGGTVGNFIYRVSDAQTDTTLFTHSFSVAQKLWPQGVAGRITLGTTNTPLAGGIVIMVSQAKNGQTTVLTDTNGNYLFHAPPGSYTLIAPAAGYLADEAAGSVTVVSSQFATNNLTLAAAPFTLSGNLNDSANSNSIGAIFMTAESTNNLFAGAFTDTNGNYTLPVSASKWKVRPIQNSLAARNYLAPQSRINVNVSSASVSSVNFSQPKVTALIYGRLLDSASNGIPGIGVFGDDNGSLYDAEGLTDTNGNYCLGVLGNTWNVSVDNNGLSALGYSGVNSVNVTIADGQAVATNFALPHVTAHLRGQVKDDLGNPIANMSLVVQQIPLQPNGNGSVNVSTDGSGNFDAGVAGGSWDIALECVSAQNSGYVDFDSFDFTVIDGQDQNGLVLVFPQATAVISGTVQDNLGHPIANVGLNASQSTGNGNYDPGCVVTDGTGHYQIKVVGGTWGVQVNASDLNGQGYGSVPNQNATISGGTATANFVATAQPDVLDYYVTKQLSYFQSGPGSIGPESNPYSDYLGLDLPYSSSVNSASVTLPTSVVTNFTPFTSATGMQISSSFASQGASDSAYPSGNYVFTINTAHSGLKTPTLNLNLSGPSYPSPVQINNYTAAQSIDPSQFFSLQWSPIPGGTTNDLVWFYVLDPSNNFNVVFTTPYPKVAGSLDGTSTGAGIIAGTLLPSHSYFGVLVYIRHVSVNTTDYPGAVGLVSFSAANTFEFATTNPPPPHFVSGFYLGAGGFTFTFSGQSSQNYALQVSTNLTTWTNLVVTNSVSGTIQYTDTHTAGSNARFYRAVTAP